MFGIVLSAFNVVLGFVFRSVIIKFGIMFAAWFLVFEVVSALVLVVPASTTLTNVLSAFPPTMWYFLELMKVDMGIPLVLAAFTTRFLIRRIPFVG